MSQKPLLIVESPSKSKTIGKYLGGEYEVIASVGHVKDLPRKELAIDIENDFEIKLHVLPNRTDFIKSLRKKAKVAPRVLIATDPDREGEAIAAHLAGEIPEEKVGRVEFTEITKAGVQAGMDQVRDLDHNMIAAQQTRRIIDRLVGYKISPILWQTLQSNMNFVKTALSAGRVQSAAVKLLIDRDRKRMKFMSATYYDIKAQLNKEQDKTEFEATLVRIDEKRIASGKDFDADTGELKTKNVQLLSESEAKSLETSLKTEDWIVKSVEEKPRTSRPKAPFTTSTLQQEASRKLRMSARQTMRTAQILYEAGFITYMRTDSTHLSAEALAGSRDLIGEKYGKEYLPANANQYASKVKNAQEAHEAIRPAHRKFKTKDEVEATLDSQAASLYELIWKRTLASQMTPAKLKQTSITIQAGKADFRASGQVILFPGYMRVYVEGQDNPEADLADKERILPAVEKGEKVNCASLSAESHSTKPPARFTEASLVKELEAKGIGRPSTFAAIMDTIVKRGYVDRAKGRLTPTFLGLAVTQLLENHFSTLVDAEFTALMEEDLDEISRGERKALPFMKSFYFGDDKMPGLEKMMDDKIDIPKACTIPMPKALGDTVEGRIGRYGPYLRRGDDTKSIPESIYLGDLTLEAIEEIFSTAIEEDRELGNDPNSNEIIWLKKGPYGPYVQLGESKTRKSIPRGTEQEDITLTLGLQLLALPRTVGNHPETEEPILADYGRYGPYIKCGKKNASLRGPETPLDITVEKAVELLANRNKKSSELRTLGDHPKTGESLLLKEGRFGPYITDGKVNASLPRTFTTESVTLEDAVEIIEKKRAAPPRKKKRKTRKKKKS
jgi:DNA topoisomerase-1